MKLTPEALFGDKPLVRVPISAKIAPGSGLVAYLLPNAEQRSQLDLWLYNPATAEARCLISGDGGGVEELTAEEKAERERRRQFAFGISSYEWHPAGGSILFPADGGAMLYDLAEDSTRSLTPEGTRQTEIRFSPKGTYIGFVREGDLYFTEVASGREVRVTEDGSEVIANGLPEFIAQEEMHRFAGYWWSPDERMIAFTRVDAEPVAVSRRFEIDADRVDVVEQRYPHAGEANVRVELFLYELATGARTRLDWSLKEDDYLARAEFSPKGDLFVQVQSRDQHALTLRVYRDGAWHDELVETSPVWVDLHDNLAFTGERMLWTSTRDGAMRLYVYEDAMEDRSGILVAGELGRINAVLAADEDTAYVTGWRDNPTEQHVYAVHLRDGSVRALTQDRAWHDGFVDAKAKTALIWQSAPHLPYRLSHLNLKTGDEQMVYEDDPFSASADDRHPYVPFRDDHANSQIGVIESDVPLYYRFTPPSTASDGERHPVVVYVYGGPGAQLVREAHAPLSLQLFAARGIGVFELDNRGSANRDAAFEGAIHRRLGLVEVEDQLKGLEFLRALDGVDAQRIGIFGHSYGGYMVLMCLAQSPGTFAAGVSVAPVTDWHLYDTHYTERYLETPARNPQGYADSGVLPVAANIKDPLLLMHGMADDNVLFTNTTKLMKTLQDHGIAFELMTYPGAKHSMQEPTVAVHRYHAILDFFTRHLLS